jgi:RimJ/RimL family protein N-acetyltransferase
MIVPVSGAGIAALALGEVPAPLRLVADSELAPPGVLAMLADLTRSIEAKFAPAAWLIVVEDEVVGLASLVAPVADGVARIGYGVAESRRGRGACTGAVGAIAGWAREDARVDRLRAETAMDNAASQKVLVANGFARIGERVDAEDGPLIVWELLARRIDRARRDP